MREIPTNITNLVGRTPMVRLTRLGADPQVELFAKVEAMNPGGSVKDRIGVAMIEAAERDGVIEPGKTTIVEATTAWSGSLCGGEGGGVRYRNSIMRSFDPPDLRRSSLDRRTMIGGRAGSVRLAWAWFWAWISEKPWLSIR